MSFDFNDRHFIVTGGAGSLGSAVVKLLLNSGARCSVPCYDQKELESFSQRNTQGIFVEAGIDLADEKQCQSFFETAIEEQGDLWGSIHIAGGFQMGSIGDTSLADFNKQLQMNTITCYNSCRTAVLWMRKSKYGGGRIVNISSRPALEPRQGKGRVAYVVSKAGVSALTEALAAEVVEEGILVNAIAPSVIDTPANRKSMPDAKYDKWPKPRQFAEQIAYLAAPENEVTRGAVIPVYGES